MCVCVYMCAHVKIISLKNQKSSQARLHQGRLMGKIQGNLSKLHVGGADGIISQSCWYVGCPVQAVWFHIEQDVCDEEVMGIPRTDCQRCSVEI